jgi:hypothetical protein
LTLPLLVSCALHFSVLFFPFIGSVYRPPQTASLAAQATPSRLLITITSAHMIPGHIWHPLSESTPNPESPRTPITPKADAPLKPNPGENRPERPASTPLPGIVYYPTQFLTAHPQALTEAILDTAEIRPIVASGRVVLTLWINPSGETVKIAVVASDLPHKFVKTAVVAFEQMRFKPGELHGQKVGSVMKIEISYDDGRLLKMEILP